MGTKIKTKLLLPLFGLWVAVVMTQVGPVLADDGSRIYAIIIANNHSLDKEFEPLRFADDDGAKYFELFSAAGADVSLLTVLDPDAQRRFPTAAEVATPPSKKAVLESINRVFAKMSRDKQAGINTHFVLVYSGHGNVGPNREGYINFLDTRFRRSELYREILARSPASFNHLILDACHSYFLVNKRGGKRDRQGDYRAIVKDFLQTEELSNYPNTGVILAASSESETHEWGRWEAGIFSHELRSALLGAGDVDGDGTVTYAEAAGCVEAANAAIDVPKARIKVFYKPPAKDVDAPLLNLSRLASQPRLKIDPTQAGRYHIEDARGIRIADLNFTQEQPIEMVLLGQGPFFLRTATQEAGIEEGQKEVSASNLEFKTLAAKSKGSVERSFRRHLYEIPYGLGFFRGAVATRERERDLLFHADIQLDAHVNPFQKQSTWGWISLSTGAATGIASGLVYYAADQSHGQYKATDDRNDARKYRETTEDRLLTSRILLGTASVLALTGATLLVLDAMDKKRKSSHTQPLVAQVEGGAVIGLGGHF